MPNHDGRDGASRDDTDETGRGADGSSDATAMTELDADREPSDRGDLPRDAAAAADSSQTPLAEAETRVVVDDGDEADDEDRTQLVTRVGTVAASAGVSADAAIKATRVLDPTRSPDRTDVLGSAGAAAVDPESPPETRVLSEVDKTAPPAVEAETLVDESAAEPRPAPRAAPAASPVAPIDAERGLAPGTVLFGEYEVVNVLGVGGMGEVYRARHRRLDEHRAIKVMHAELSKKKGASEFFYREAKALLAVRHPAVVHCHDLLSDDAGRVYLIMEMIEGIPLSKKMNDGPLSPDDVAILGARVAHGLSAAHRKGVIHRDLSPDNIVLPNGRVQEAKIIDFGIAKLLEEGEGTIVDGFKGKLSYASPEQLGFFGGKIDGRSDFYSLGLVLVAAALGRPMAMGTTVMEAVDARRNFDGLPDAIPVGLRSAIQPLLALEPKDRPKYVDRLFVVPGGFDPLTDSGPVAAPRSSAGRSGSSTRMPAIPAALAAAAVVLALVGGLYISGVLGGRVTLRESQTAAAPSSPSVADASRVASDGGDSAGAGAAAALVSRRAGESGSDLAAGAAAAAAGDGAGIAATAAAAAPSPERKVEALPADATKVAAKPKPRRLRASDRLKIIGLINNAKLALEESRLMTPAGDNAYDRYRRVLALDPSNVRAKRGLREIASRYLGMANRAVDKGDLEGARRFVDRAKRADAGHPEIASVEGRLSR